MNIHIQPASVGTTPLSKNKYRVGEIVSRDDRLAVVLPCAGKTGKLFFRFMHAEKIDGEYRARISYSQKSANLLFEQMNSLTPTLKLEESGCHLHALLTTTDAGEVIRDFMDLMAFEATLTGWYETLRSIPAGSLDVLRNVLDGSPASDRLLNVYENAKPI